MERVESVNHDPDFERPIDPRRTRRTRRNLLWPVAAIVAVVLAAVARVALLPRGQPGARLRARRSACRERRTACAAGVAALSDRGRQTGSGRVRAAARRRRQRRAAAGPDGLDLRRRAARPHFPPARRSCRASSRRSTTCRGRRSRCRGCRSSQSAAALETTQADGRILLRADNASRYDDVPSRDGAGRHGEARRCVRALSTRCSRRRTRTSAIRTAISTTGSSR